MADPDVRMEVWAEPEEPMRIKPGRKMAIMPWEDWEDWKADRDSLETALRRCCEESDYCYACDCHPSHGHAKDCPLAATGEGETG